MRLWTTLVTLGSTLVLSAVSAKAEEIALGYMSFDEFIPGTTGGSPGTDGFTLGNLTGDPSINGNDLPPTWPVLTTVTFLNSSLTLFLAGCVQNCTQRFDLGGIGPQFFQSPDLQFPDTTAFAWAAFSAMLDSTNFQLDGGGTLTASTNQISALLMPASGGSLIAGTDSVLISVTSGASATPEPSNLLMMATVIPFLWLSRKFSHVW